MAISLTKRLVKGSPLTKEEHDANLAAIEEAINDLGGGDLDTRLTTAEGEIDALQADLDQAELDISNHEGRIVSNEAHSGTTSGNPHAVTKADIGLSLVTNHAQLRREDGDLNTFTEKTTLVDDDVLVIEDSEASYGKKKVKLSSLPFQHLSSNFQEVIDNVVNDTTDSNGQVTITNTIGVTPGFVKAKEVGGLGHDVIVDSSDETSIVLTVKDGSFQNVVSTAVSIEVTYY